MKGIRGLLQKSVIIDIFLSLVIIYLVYVAIKNDNVEYSEEVSFDVQKMLSKIKISKDVKKRLKSLDDVRSKKCKKSEYFNDEKVTLVSYFHNYQLYDLKMALLTATDELIGQIVIVDDGSTIDTVTEDAKDYFENYHLPVVLLRNEIATGVGGVLKKALRSAFYDVIVFIDTTVICNKEWLPPLLQQLTFDPNSIAVPHFDKATLHPIYYIPVQENYVATLMWNLNTIFKIRNDFKSPGLRPDLFAFRKSMLKSIGMLDWNFITGGGEIAELAVRAWACGKSIKVIECSRVGLIGFDRPFKITSGNNLKQFVGVWFNDDQYKPYSSLAVSDYQKSTIKDRKKFIFEDLKCKDAMWYFKVLSEKNVNIKKNALKVGKIKVGSGLCAVLAQDSKIDMRVCDDNSEVKPESAFQITMDNRFIVNDKCLTLKDSYIITADCRDDDKQQRWQYNEYRRIINLETQMCACHVTDPNKDIPNRQILMVQNCNEKDNERFQSFTFLPI